MPTISSFYGITIQMFWTDHPPPHFHVTYAEHRASIDIRALTLIEGHLPSRVLSMVVEWATLHQRTLLENWNLCAKGLPPIKIPPLE
ncbi:MAG: DUF4160 domain-containing protein [Gemmatimonadaceae bacterium]